MSMYITTLNSRYKITKSSLLPNDEIHLRLLRPPFDTFVVLLCVVNYVEAVLASDCKRRNLL